MAITASMFGQLMKQASDEAQNSANIQGKSALSAQEAKQALALQEFLHGKMIPGTPATPDTTEFRRNDVPEAAAKPLPEGQMGPVARPNDLYSDVVVPGKPATPATFQPGVSTLADVAKHKANLQSNLELASDPKFQQLNPEGSSWKVGDISGGMDPALKYQKNLNAQRSIQTKRLGDEYKRTVGPVEEQLTNAENLLTFLENPNAYDQKKAQVLMARMVEGKGQRLLDSVIKQMGASKQTLEGSIQDKANWLFGTAQAGLQPAQLNALKDSVFKYHNELAPQYEEARSRYQTLAPSLAGDLDPTALKSILDSNLMTGNRLFDSIAAKRKAYEEQSKNRNTLQPKPIYTEDTGIADRMKNRLKSFLGGNKTPAPKSSLSAEDQQALEWAKNNPGPKATAILNKLGVK